MLYNIPYDVIINIILPYIDPNERVQLYITSTSWYQLSKYLNQPTKPTFKSLTSMSLIAHYGLYLTDNLIKRIITTPHSYDFYANELRYKVDTIDFSKYGTVDDERYITTHKINCILNRSISTKLNKSMINAASNHKLTIAQLEDYAVYRTDIDPSLYASYVKTTSCTKPKLYDIINKCCEYDNDIVMQAIFNATQYGQADAYRMLKYGAIKCLQYSTRNYTGWDRTLKTANEVDVHPNVIDYVVNMWHLFDKWPGPAMLIKSTSITYELASRVDLSELSNITSCNPCVLPLIADKLNYGYRLEMALEGHIDPPTIKHTYINLASINELIIMIRNMDKYVDVLTPMDAPLLHNGHSNNNKSKPASKPPAIEKYSNDPIKFINYFNNRLKHKWSGNITHPDIYKAIVVQHWSSKCSYTGPCDRLTIGNNSLHTLSFHSDIGNPLIGLATIDQLKQSTRIPTISTLTIYEKESIIRYDRDDIVKAFKLDAPQALAYDNSAYTYLKHGASKIDYRLVDNNGHNPMPDYDFEPILLYNNHDAAKQLLPSSIYSLYFGTTPITKTKEFKKLSTIHVPLLIRTKTTPYYSVDTPHLLKLLESMPDLSLLQGPGNEISLPDYVRLFNRNKPLQLGPKLFSAVKHIYNPKLVEAIEAHLNKKTDI